MKGQIVKVISNDYTVKYEKGKVVCKARGVFRNKNITPLAGDYCLFDEENKLITEILDRKNELKRPPVSNIDYAIIVMSTVEPDFSSVLLDKMIDIIEFNNIKPIICISKSDLLLTDKIKEYVDYYKKIGYVVLFNTEIDILLSVIEGKTVILTGQSGAGKSSLLNRIDSSLNLKTDEISMALGRGKHTTRSIEFYEINNSLIADTPGFSSLNFDDLTKEDIRDNFIEFNEYRNECKYSDCMHIKEDECEVKRRLGKDILEERYNNYIDFIKEKENGSISINFKQKR
ncbi:MAG: ribosome small subunit-dependent GTPase A [Bacilli bacterium]|nr:ribosome small subunit-dependent GTPase A [Bacilli bacterium]